MDVAEAKEKELGEDPGAKPRRPRRERKEFDADDKPENAEQPSAADPAAARPRRRRAAEQEAAQPSDNSLGGGGWMSSPSKQSHRLIIEEEDTKDAANPLNKDKFFEEGNDDILVIPDLDEDGYDADQRVAHAPRNVGRKIPSMVELENEVKISVPSAEGGLDLGVLLRSLVPVAFVEESDTIWTFESLLRDITDELTAPAKTVLDQSSAANSPMAFTPTKGGDSSKLKQKSFNLGEKKLK